MPKISGSSDDVLRMVLEAGGDALDDRLRNILASQVGSDPGRAERPQPPPLPDSAATTIHRVKVSLRGARPPVWRRLELPSGMGLDLVHETLQTAFGWFDCHYHQFETGCGTYGDLAQNADTWRDDESEVALGQVAGTRATVGYVYDFGDNWRHELIVETVSPAEPGVRYPRCTAGRGLAPAENSGGIRDHNATAAVSPGSGSSRPGDSGDSGDSGGPGDSGDSGDSGGPGDSGDSGDSGGPASVDPAELTSAMRGLSTVIIPAD